MSLPAGRQFRCRGARRWRKYQTWFHDHFLCLPQRASSLCHRCRSWPVGRVRTLLDDVSAIMSHVLKIKRLMELETRAMSNEDTHSHFFRGASLLSTTMPKEGQYANSADGFCRASFHCFRFLQSAFQCRITTSSHNIPVARKACSPNASARLSRIWLHEGAVRRK